ncbi:hypothetical protein MRX96_034155 [Rhipicephalus microplus]
MSFSQNTVVCILFLCIGINIFSATSYLLGHYRALGSDGLLFDVLLGIETGVNLVSDFILLNALQSSSNPAVRGPSHAEVVETFRKFLMLNTGTILFCCVTHIRRIVFLSSARNPLQVRVYGATNAQEEQEVRNGVFSQLAFYYVFLLTVKGAILYNIFGYYKEFKDNPPSANVIFVFNPLANLGQPFVILQTNPGRRGALTTTTTQ